MCGINDVCANLSYLSVFEFVVNVMVMMDVDEVL